MTRKTPPRRGRPAPRRPAEDIGDDGPNVRTLVGRDSIVIEGAWDDVWKAMNRCQDDIHWTGGPTISVTLKIHSRPWVPAPDGSPRRVTWGIVAAET